jgi:hypothetical protein
MLNWAKRFTRIGQDGFQLARALLQNTTSSGKRTVSFKPLLLEHARKSNTIANSLLQVDKQVGLVKYYGVMGYFKERLQTSNKVETSAFSFSTDKSQTSTSDGQSTARVAFMITSSMKEELSEDLGYQTDQIKQMTPLQASLVLRHKITPETLAEQLPILEQEYRELKKEEQEQRQLEIRKQEATQDDLDGQNEEEQQQQQGKEKQTLALDKSSQSQAPPSQETSYWLSDPSKSRFGYMSSNTLIFPNSENNGFGSFWFEVVETNTESGEKSRVGLYQDEREAELGLQTRQEIADRKSRPLKYDMLAVDKNQIFSQKEN